MARTSYYRVFLKEGSVHYLVCRLIQQKSDESLLLQIEPSKLLAGGNIGQIEITGDTFEILYSKIDTPVEIEHTAIHATGQSHAKLSDGTYIVNYSQENVGIPLAQLKTVKHLGTLVTRQMTDQDVVVPSRNTDVIIEREIGLKCTIIDLLAIPKGSARSFNFNWEMENKQPVRLMVGLTVVPFKGFDAVLFTRSSDQFDKLPPGTLHLLDMNSLVPFVSELDDKKAIIKLSSLKFEEIIEIETNKNMQEGQSVLKATSKYL